VDLSLSKDSDFTSLGLHPIEASAFRSLADEHGWDVFVRTGNASRVANVGRPGLRPKMAGVYQKTNKDAFAAGLVVYTEEQRAKARNDLDAIRHPDPAHSALSARVLASEKLNLRQLGPGTYGVRDGAGNFIYGDIDIHGVYRRSKGSSRAQRVGARTFVPLFNDKLSGTGLHSPSLLEFGTPLMAKEFGVLPFHAIQHGAHDEWRERNDESYAGGVNMGPLPGVIHFRPGAKPYHIATVPQYREVLASLGLDSTYTAAAWSNGRNRLAKERYTVHSDAF
jgi:insecticidal toxin complex protein TccC